MAASKAAEHVWELIEDGYHKESRYVHAATGRIVGSVRGLKYENKAWQASYEGKHIGDYTTEALGKKAVELAAPHDAERGQ